MQQGGYAFQTFSLSKDYGDGAACKALNNVSISLRKGEFLLLTGTSGAGKTTLLNLIGTLDPPTSGRVLVNDVDVYSLRGNHLADFRRENIGFIFQLYHLVPTLTAVENVSLPLIPYRRQLNFGLQDRAQELLKRVGLTHRLYHLPSQLSGGEQQRVAIARALINRPMMILADEPTGNLDSKSGAEVFALLHELNHELGLSLMVATHDASLASRADRVIKLHDGEVQDFVT